MKKMIKITIVTLIFFFFGQQSLTAQGGQWVWLGGDTLITIQSPAGNNGLLGIPASTNWPPDVYGAAYWTGSDGHLYFFGGERDSIWPYQMHHSDMWRYNTVSGFWTWMNGPGTINSPGSFGIQGVPTPGNHPPAMKRCITWTTPGTLWLFGGNGARAGAYSWNLNYDDVWKYDLATQQWTWMKGTGNGTAQPNYGSLGVPAVSNTPGYRWAAPSWVGNNGNLWLYGGHSDAPNSMEDLWMFDIVSNMWTWMGGSQTPTLTPQWGTLGIPSASNNPGERSDAMGWKDSQGNFLMFGGNGRSPFYNDGFNDLWKYDSTSGFWTWINGQNISGAHGYYPSYCDSGQPAGRIFPGAWASDDNGNAWMFGGAAPWWTLNHRQNDLWFYNGSSNRWIRYAGDTANFTVLSWPNIYGQLGVPSPANVPQSRIGAAMWLVSSDSAIYLFGGYGYSTNMSQLWRFDYDPSCAMITGLQNEDHNAVSEIKVFPNPFHNVLSVSIQKQKINKATFTFKNILGQTEFSEEENNISIDYTKIIDLSFYSSGIYFLEMNIDGKRMVKKIVKE